MKPLALSADICIYGGTASGVIAAVEARRRGRTVILLNPGKHLGGMTSGGLSSTDIGNRNAIGGLALEFYKRVGRRYGVAEELKFEPHVAERVFDDMIRESGALVYRDQFLSGITKSGKRILSVTTEENLTVTAKMFLDTTYEGDLMAKAGVSFTVGREDNSKYRETINGAQVRDKHQFEHPVDPFIREGDPASGYLPEVDETPLPPVGTGDKRVQAYNFRTCLTKDTFLRLPFPRPKGYNRQNYALLERYIATGWTAVFDKFDTIRNNKVDNNNHGAVSTDFIGQNYAWPNATYRVREEIFQAHLRYQQGLYYFLSHDASVPSNIRAEMEKWGLCRDEFVDTGGWPGQLYIREARRMISDYTLTENNCRGILVADDSVGLGAYGIDSHNVRRFVQNGAVRNEGDVQVGGFPPYPISFRSIIPRRGEIENLVIPVCLSASHIAYGSVRMEPVFMILGQSAAIAADIAIHDNCNIQNVPYSELSRELMQRGQIIKWRMR